MSHQKILRNTLFLYLRQILIIGVNLYALRVVLTTLGVDDYGIFTVVGGFVTLMAFLPGTMAAATQRFFAFALGQQDQAKLNKTFSANWLLYALISLIILLGLETIGLWYVSAHLSIPQERITAAITLYHFTVAGFVLSVFSSPFMAILVAHEDMHLYAAISIIEAILKLAAAILLVYLPWDSLSLYGQLLLIVSALNTTLYVVACLKNYSECQFRRLYWDTALVREILGFTGWTLFGQLSTVFRNQAVTVLLNQFFNPATVAARAIATTVAGQTMVFAQNFNTGLYPAIIKAYAADQKKDMLALVTNGSKLTFFLMWVFALPLLIEMETILRLWLKTPPEPAVLFTRLAIVEALILSISLPIATAARAPGKMRLYELSLGCIQILIFLASWLALKAGCPAVSVFIVAIMANVLMFKVRLLIVNKLVGLPITPYYKQVVIPTGLVVLASSLPVIWLGEWLPSGFFFTLVLVVFSVILSTFCMYYLGLDRLWRERSREMLLRRLAKIRSAR